MFVVPRGSGLLNSVDVRHRFLDRLILPCPLGELSNAQIQAINRFREWEREADPQFEKAFRARRMICRACEAIKSSALLEIGMGKFPITEEAKVAEYFGIDIDSEAISHCRALGISAGTASEAVGRFDTVAAIYSLHFAAGPDLYEAIENCVGVNPVMLSVVVDDGTQHFSGLMARLTAILPLTRVIVSSGSRRERFIVSSVSGTEGRFQAAVKSIERDNGRA